MLGGWGVAIACSGSGFHSSEQPREAGVDSGSGGDGSGGSSGAGGAVVTGGTSSVTHVEAGIPDAEAGPPPECRTNDECARVTCNAKPLCEDGRCVPGSPCANPDTTHCVARCDVGDAGAACVVTARDTDGDGHGDSRCAPAPGDDCDDAHKTVYPGARELCDGLDNDCNDKQDLDDGLTLGGAPVTLDVAPDTGSVAIAPVTGGYAILDLRQHAFGNPGNPIDLDLVDAKGALTRHTSLTTIGMSEAVMTRTGASLSFFGTSLNTTGPLLLQVAPEAPTASAVTVPIDSTATTGATAVTSTSTGETILVWTRSVVAPLFTYYALFGQTIGADGVASTARALDQASNTQSSATRPAVAVGPKGVGVAWLQVLPSTGSPGYNTYTVRFTGMDAKLENPSIAELATFSIQRDGTLESALSFHRVRPQIVADGDDYVVGWFDYQGLLQMIRVSRTGDVLCGPTTIYDVHSWGLSNSLVSSGDAVLAPVVNSSNKPALLRFLRSCVAAPPLPLGLPGVRVAVTDAYDDGRTKIALGNPALARGDDGRTAVTWIEHGGSTPSSDGGSVPDPSDAGPAPYRLTLRILGDHLCNE